MSLESGTEYRVLSLHPEWAWAIFHASKDVENRSWATSHRGPLLIHASSHKSGAEELEGKRQYIAATSGLSLQHIPENFERSTILGIVDLVDCVEGARSAWADDGYLHWLVRSPRLLAEPVRGIDGKMKVWRWQAHGEHKSMPVEQAASVMGPAASLGPDRLTEEKVMAAFQAIATQSRENGIRSADCVVAVRRSAA